MTNSFPNKSVPPDISINDLTLEYQHHFLFNRFSLQLSAGSWNCLLGASGVGKSTLLKLLAGLPTGVDPPIPAGVITTSDNLPLAGRVTYMAQQDLLMPWLTVLENCLVGYRLRGQKVSAMERQRALQLLSLTGLENAVELHPPQLSGGMRQRVALVRTLLEERPIVLMDEPFSALDTITRLKLQDVAAELLMGKTVLLVTHDPLEALRLADRIYVLRGAPARLSEVLAITNPRPRSPQETSLLARQGELLNLLAA
jgi:putative hydroxymethylpyrimidine transport system ATP-binding protein